MAPLGVARLCLLALTLHGAAALVASMEFATWMHTHNKTYASPAELQTRAATYAANVALISRHNAEANAGRHSFRLGVNSWADLSQTEFSAAMGITPMPRAPPAANLRSSVVQRVAGAAPPSSVDWVSKGAVGPVVDQGQMGQVFAFVLSAATASLTAVTTGKPYTRLSVEQLGECTDQFGVEQYIIRHGLCTEADYPASSGAGCQDDKCKPAASVNSWVDVATNSQLALMSAAAVTPVAVAVEADQASFQFYTSGVLTTACGSALNHQLLLVGYDTDASSGLDYWHAQNTWGAGWGEGGYIRLGRGAAFPGPGQCGIQMMPVYPQ